MGSIYAVTFFNKVENNDDFFFFPFVIVTVKPSEVVIVHSSGTSSALDVSNAIK